MSPAKKTKKKPAAKKTAKKKAPASKKAPKKTAKKAPSKKAPVKKAAAKKTAKKAPVKKAAAKKTAKKAPVKKAAAKKAAKKAPATKKEAAKAPSKKAASPKPAPAAAKAPSKRVAPRRKSPPRPPPSPASEILPSRAPITPDSKPAGLGNRWTCYECGSKFYDLGKEEPLCPKCGANQHNAPKVDPRQRIASAEPARPRETRAMAPLLEEEEEAERPVVPAAGDELDIGLDSVEDAGEELTEEQDATAEEEED